MSSTRRSSSVRSSTEQVIADPVVFVPREDGPLTRSSKRKRLVEAEAVTTTQKPQKQAKPNPVVTVIETPTLTEPNPLFSVMLSVCTHFSETLIAFNPRIFLDETQQNVFDLVKDQTKRISDFLTLCLAHLKEKLLPNPKSSRVKILNADGTEYLAELILRLQLQNEQIFQNIEVQEFNLPDPQQNSSEIIIQKFLSFLTEEREKFLEYGPRIIANLGYSTNTQIGSIPSDPRFDDEDTLEQKFLGYVCLKLEELFEHTTEAIESPDADTFEILAARNDEIFRSGCLFLDLMILRHGKRSPASNDLSSLRSILGLMKHTNPQVISLVCLILGNLDRARWWKHPPYLIQFSLDLVEVLQRFREYPHIVSNASFSLTNIILSTKNGIVLNSLCGAPRGYETLTQITEQLLEAPNFDQSPIPLLWILHALGHFFLFSLEFYKDTKYIASPTSCVQGSLSIKDRFFTILFKCLGSNSEELIKWAMYLLAELTEKSKMFHASILFLDVSKLNLDVFSKFLEDSSSNLCQHSLFCLLKMTCAPQCRKLISFNKAVLGKVSSLLTDENTPLEAFSLACRLTSTLYSFGNVDFPQSQDELTLSLVKEKRAWLASNLEIIVQLLQRKDQQAVTWALSFISTLVSTTIDLYSDLRNFVSSQSVIHLITQLLVNTEMSVIVKGAAISTLIRLIPHKDNKSYIASILNKGATLIKLCEENESITGHCLSLFSFIIPEVDLEMDSLSVFLRFLDPSDQNRSIQVVRILTQLTAPKVKNHESHRAFIAQKAMPFFSVLLQIPNETLIENTLFCLSHLVGHIKEVPIKQEMDVEPPQRTEKPSQKMEIEPHPRILMASTDAVPIETDEVLTASTEIAVPMEIEHVLPEKTNLLERVCPLLSHTSERIIIAATWLLLKLQEKEEHKQVIAQLCIKPLSLLIRVEAPDVLQLGICWLLGSLIEVPSTRDAILINDVISQLVRLLRHTNDEVILSACRVLSAFCSVKGYLQEANRLIVAETPSAFRNLFVLLHHKNQGIIETASNTLVHVLKSKMSIKALLDPRQKLESVSLDILIRHAKNTLGILLEQSQPNKPALLEKTLLQIQQIAVNTIHCLCCVINKVNQATVAPLIFDSFIQFLLNSNSHQKILKGVIYALSRLSHNQTTRTSLLDAIKRLTNEKKLTKSVFCSYLETFSSNRESMTEESVTFPITESTSNGDTYQFLYNMNRYHDVFFQIEQYKVPCHKVVVACSSRYFDQLIEEGNVNTFSIENISLARFKKIIDFVYLKQICFDSIEDAQELLEGSTRFQIPELEDLCIHFLSGNVLKDHFNEIFRFGLSTSNNRLLEKLVDWFCLNYNLISPEVRAYVVDENWEKINSILISVQP